MSISSVVILLLLAAAITTAKNVYTGSVSLGFDQMKSMEDNSRLLTSSREDARLATLIPIPKQERRHPVSAVQRTVPTASMQYPIKIHGVSDSSENHLQNDKEHKSKEELEMMSDLERVRKLKQRQRELRKHLEEQESRRLESIRQRIAVQQKKEEERRQLLALRDQRNYEQALKEKEYQRQLESERMQMKEERRLQEEERQRLETEKQLMEQELNKQKYIEEQRRQAEEQRRIEIENERIEEGRRRADEELRRQQAEEELRRHLEEERRQRLAEEYRRKQNEEKMKEELHRRELVEREKLAEAKRQTDELRREAEKERKRAIAEETRKQAEERSRMLEEMERIAKERNEIEKEKRRLEGERKRLEELLQEKQEVRRRLNEHAQERHSEDLRNTMQSETSTSTNYQKEEASTYAYMMPSQDFAQSTRRPLKKKTIKINRLQRLRALPIVQLEKDFTKPLPAVSPSVLPVLSSTVLPVLASSVVPVLPSSVTPVLPSSVAPIFTTTSIPKLVAIGKPQVVVPLVRRKISLKPGSMTGEDNATPTQEINQNTGYKNYYQEWYKNAETSTVQAPALPPLPPAWAQQLPTSGGGFYGIVDPRLEGKHLDKEQLDQMCLSIKGLTKAFGIKKPKTFAEQNCSLIKMYYKQVTCEQIIHVMEYCEPVLSTRRH